MIVDRLDTSRFSHTTLLGDCHLYTYEAMQCYTVDARLLAKRLSKVKRLGCLWR